jgi:hypothetical protein
MGERERPGDRGRGRRPGGPRDRGSWGPGGGKGGGRDKDKGGLRAKAQEIQASAGIPYNLALQVARGDRTLSDVLQRMMAGDKIDQLVKKHDIPRSLAAQVALGQADLDAVLLKKELDTHIAQHRDRSILASRLEDKATVGLALHGQRTVVGKIEGMTVYEFVLRGEGAEAPETVHKLQAKYAWDPAEYKLVKKAIETSKDGRRTTEPIYKPQDRYPCSDRRLFGFLRAGRPVAVETLEGELLRGKITWLGRWEFGLEAKGGGHLTVFRHAIKQVEEA